MGPPKSILNQWKTFDVLYWSFLRDIANDLYKESDNTEMDPRASAEIVLAIRDSWKNATIQSQPEATSNMECSLPLLLQEKDIFSTYHACYFSSDI